VRIRWPTAPSSDQRTVPFVYFSSATGLAKATQPPEVRSPWLVQEYRKPSTSYSIILYCRCVFSTLRPDVPVNNCNYCELGRCVCGPSYSQCARLIATSARSDRCCASRTLRTRSELRTEQVEGRSAHQGNANFEQVCRSRC